MIKFTLELDSNNDKYFTHYLAEEDCEGGEMETYLDYNFFNEWEWEMDLYDFRETLDEVLVYPVKLTFNNYSWDNRTGYTFASHSQELIDKVFSLDNDRIVFHSDESGTYIITSNHDKPTGFRIDIETVEEDDIDE